ncbi:GDP-mannose 4,6-dehydratase, partial [Clostridium perfringens]|uniref:GDP-mannose 4,6-dehydratase n=1 Tax=Clostridium perfringens TaxID=1502 RepID=UPI002AC4F5F7
IITQLLAGETEIKLGSLAPTRDFNYVKDTTRGFLEFSKSDLAIGEEINIATQQEISIEELALELISQINPKAKIICENERLRPDKSEVNRLLGSNEKIKKLTNWAPKYTFEKGIEETIEWFKIKENLQKY